MLEGQFGVSTDVAPATDHPRLSGCGPSSNFMSALGPDNFGAGGRTADQAEKQPGAGAADAVRMRRVLERSSGGVRGKDATPDRWGLEVEPMARVASGADLGREPSTLGSKSSPTCLGEIPDLGVALVLVDG